MRIVKRRSRVDEILNSADQVSSNLVGYRFQGGRRIYQHLL